MDSDYLIGSQVTRSFGDLQLKSHEFNGEPLFVRYRVPEPFNPPLLGSEPSITVRLLSPYDAFVIAASDGLFQYLTNQEAVDLVGSSPRKVRSHAVPLYQFLLFLCSLYLCSIFFFFLLLF